MVLKERKQYMFHIMVLKGRFLNEIWTSICPREDKLNGKLRNGLKIKKEVVPPGSNFSQSQRC